ncbi:MAG: DUF393 domain-containing protein [Rhodothermaceae bacterium]|nr:DUF393 domain-containing protein [Rhodothermaceae bacterium]
MSQNHKSEAIVLFDGVCNLCNASINFIIDNDSRGYFKFASLQSPEAETYLNRCAQSSGDVEVRNGYDYLSSVLLYENGQCYRESTAVLRIARKLRGGWPLMYGLILIPEPIRNVIYHWVARNRYRWFGKQDACRLPSPELRARFLDGLTSSSS